MSDQPIQGRGAAFNPPNRFETIEYVRDDDAAEESAPRTILLRDPSRTIINYNDSPDVGFEASINPYRGCEHGCIYCFARPTHEFLGFSAGLDFETKIVVKEDAPELLRKELASARWQPKVIAISGVTDCYQPIERRLQLTRRCLEVLTEFRNPVVIITKNHLVTRDAGLLAELAAHDAALVCVSITTLDESIARLLEPRTSAPRLRLEAIRTLSEAGVPTAVLTAPIIPAINDHEIPAILDAASEAGARSASYTILRLPWAVAPLFERWLDDHMPERKEKVLNRIRGIRSGKLNDPRWGTRRRGPVCGADSDAFRSELPEVGAQSALVRALGRCVPQVHSTAIAL
ncbi:MAG TPA: PA0069 family radical SAM protein [Thermoanaerobaculia bacterium]|nr:PA0069 family radical SAM protein [Thermoanaerobaculia bacterium]